MAAPMTIGPVPESQVYREGLQALQEAIGSEGLLDFPRRPNGTPVLLRQSFFQRVLSEQMQLSSFPDPDVIAAQADVKHLSLAQLLRLRGDNVDGSGAAQQVRQFLTRVDELIEKRLADRLLPPGGPLAPPAAVAASAAPEVARQAVLAYGAQQRVGGDSGRWLLRTEHTAAVLKLAECELHELEDGVQAPTYCCRNLSRAGAACPKERRQLHWEVKLCINPSQFEVVEPATASPRRQRASLGASTPRRRPSTFVARTSPSRAEGVEGGTERIAEDSAESPEAGTEAASPSAPAAEVSDPISEEQESGDVQAKEVAEAEPEELVPQEASKVTEDTCMSADADAAAPSPPAPPACEDGFVGQSVCGETAATETASTCSSGVAASKADEESIRKVQMMLEASEAARLRLEEEVANLRSRLVDDQAPCSEKDEEVRLRSALAAMAEAADESLSDGTPDEQEDLFDEEEYDEAAGGEAPEGPVVLGTSHLLNCSKDSRLTARGKDGKASKSMLKRMKKGAAKRLWGSHKKDKEAAKQAQPDQQAEQAEPVELVEPAEQAQQTQQTIDCTNI